MQRLMWSQIVIRIVLLTFACWKGHQGVVELLLVRKADIEHRTKKGFTPLMFAALGGHKEVAHHY